MNKYRLTFRRQLQYGDHSRLVSLEHSIVIRAKNDENAKKRAKLLTDVEYNYNYGNFFDIELLTLVRIVEEKSVVLIKNKVNF